MLVISLLLMVGCTGSKPDEDGDGYAADGGDCDDQDAAINPEADEVCDGEDNDCDGSIDQDATDIASWYADADGDEWGDADMSVTACEPPAGYVADATDCDDSDSNVFPNATEYCNGYDDDCDGTIDEDATDALIWYADADMDAYGDAATTVSACTQPDGYTNDATDCDDTNSTVFPSATEVCDSLDNDCDGEIDEEAINAGTWYADQDEDGFGDSESSMVACTQPDGYTSDATDCDDGDATVHIGASEDCDLIDDDCDGDIDEDAIDATTWYADADGDGYGLALLSVTACEAPENYVADATDCDDGDAEIYPGAAEYCNDAVDSDCDGANDPTGRTLCLSSVTIYEGQNNGDYAGNALAVADADGDGARDVLIGAPLANLSLGSVYIDNDAVGGALPSVAEYQVQAGSVATSSGFGQSIAVGEFEGDPYVAIGAGNGLSASSLAYTGTVALLRGPFVPSADPSAQVSLAVSATSSTNILLFEGEGYIHHAGRSLGWGEGADGPVLLVGANGENTRSDSDFPGGVYVVDITTVANAADSGTTDFDLASPSTYGTRIYGENANDEAGYDVAVVDVEGDGIDEILTSAPYSDRGGENSGAVYLLSTPGIATSDTDYAYLADSETIWDGEAAGDLAGFSVAAGDLDGDGYAEIVVGAPYAEADTLSAAGAVYIVQGTGSFPASGSLSGAWIKLVGEQAEDRAGFSVVADLVDDSRNPILVVGTYAMHEDGIDVGGAYLFYGASLVAGTSSLSTADLRMVGVAGGERTGEVIAGGDIIGGIGAELLIGAVYYGTGATGAAFLVPSSSY